MHTKKEARWYHYIKIKKEKMNSKKRCLWKKGKEVGSKGSRPNKRCLWKEVVGVGSKGSQLTRSLKPTLRRSVEKLPYEKNYHAKCTNHHENASHPNGFQLWKTINKMTCFNIKTPCKRMIHVCLGQIFFVAKCIKIECSKYNKYI